jgi:hypothetical protein
LAEAYSLNVPSKATLEEIRAMLYDAEPTMAEGRYQRRGNERHKGGTPAAGSGSKFQVVPSSDEESWDEVFVGVREQAAEVATGVTVPVDRLYILDDWPRPPGEYPRCLECGREMHIDLPTLPTPNVIPTLSCASRMKFKCFGVRSLTDAYGDELVGKMKAMADHYHDDRLRRDRAHFE